MAPSGDEPRNYVRLRALRGFGEAAKSGQPDVVVGRVAGVFEDAYDQATPQVSTAVHGNSHSSSVRVTKSQMASSLTLFDESLSLEEYSDLRRRELR